MNINPLIEATFKDFEVGGESVPIFLMHYEGNAEKYLTYYQWSELPQNFADNENQSKICYATIDVFSKGNYKNIVEAVKQKLKENGFTWTDNGSEMYENDTGYFHIPINFYISDFK